MAETAKRIFPAVNAVDGFNPAEFTRELRNEDGSTSLYLDVRYRLLWFRLHRPDGKISSEVIHVDDRSAVVRCRLYNDRNDGAEQFVAQAFAQRFAGEGRYGGRYLETAETAALGRVLAAAGYGTQFCGLSDLPGGVIADAPVEMRRAEADAAAPDGKTAGQPAAPGHLRIEPVRPSAEEDPQQTLEALLDTMTLEDAKAVTVDFGRYAGCPLGDVALRKPGDIEWYARNYRGHNLALRAGAMLLLRAAARKAG